MCRAIISHLHPDCHSPTTVGIEFQLKSNSVGAVFSSASF
jgi:hypothetical protein